MYNYIICDLRHIQKHLILDASTALVNVFHDLLETFDVCFLKKGCTNLIIYILYHLSESNPSEPAETKESKKGNPSDPEEKRKQKDPAVQPLEFESTEQIPLKLKEIKQS